MNTNLIAIKTIAQVLGEINNEVVFVGGATVEFYIDDPAAPTPQPSEDIDCVVEILTYGEWIKFEEKLRDKGFKDYDITGEDLAPPTCRKYIMGMTVDFMPIEEKVLGYSNRWFEEGIKKPLEKSIEGVKVRIFSLEYFLTTKFQAYLDRGQKNDIRLSQDLEDLTEIFDGVKGIKDIILNAKPEIKTFIIDTIKKLLKDRETVEEAITGLLNYGSQDLRAKRAERIFEIFNELVGI